MWQPKISAWFWLETATKTDEVDVKWNLSVFELFSVLTLKPLIANHKTANFDAEAENNKCPITIAVMLCT